MPGRRTANCLSRRSVSLASVWERLGPRSHVCWPGLLTGPLSSCISSSVFVLAGETYISCSVYTCVIIIKDLGDTVAELGELELPRRGGPRGSIDHVGKWDALATHSRGRDTADRTTQVRLQARLESSLDFRGRQLCAFRFRDSR